MCFQIHFVLLYIQSFLGVVSDRYCSFRFRCGKKFNPAELSIHIVRFAFAVVTNSTQRQIRSKYDLANSFFSTFILSKAFIILLDLFYVSRIIEIEI